MGTAMIAGAGLGTIGAIGGMINDFTTAGKLNGMAKAINPVDPTYTPSQYAKDRLSLAQNLLNARMPGASNMQANIQSNQATQTNNITKTATSSAEALTSDANAQGQTNQAVANLGTQEQQDYYNREGNLQNAQQGMVAEGDKVYQDQLRDYQEKMNLKNAYMGAAMQDKSAAWSSLSSTGMGAASMASAFNNMGTGGSSSMSSFQAPAATYNPGLASTAGGYSSPASQYASINL
jgi:hypothetical protein